MHLLFLWVVAIGSLVAGTPSRRANYVVHERRVAEPVNWVKTSRLEAHRYITIRIGLAQQNLHCLEEALMSVAQPDSQTYGHHWPPERVAEHFAPNEATISTVKSWLRDAGIHPDRLQLSRSKGWISVKVHVSEAECLLKAEYYVYTSRFGHQQISCESYSLPEDIRDHVDLIRPTVHLFHHNPSKSIKHSDTTLSKAPTFDVPETPSLDDCDKFITPQCLRRLYSIDYKPEVPQRNSLGIVEFTPQAYLDSDLDLFFSRYSTSQKKRRPVVVSIDGGVVQQQNQSIGYNMESDLDLEYAMTLTDPMPVTVLQTGDLVQGAGFDNWLDAIDGSFCTFEGGDDPNQDGIYPDPRPGGYNHSESCGIIAPPKVVSVSYGQDESTATPAYARRQCNEYGKLGLMGTTVLYGSGDDGVAGINGICLGPKGAGRFSPLFPATCPFVTAVGATQINPNSTVYKPESACEQRALSGGGFSNIFSMPRYQEDAVRGYLKQHPPPYTAEQYNNTGRARAYPDLSANGANFVIARNGKFSLAFGTSASVQVVGAIMALINDARLAHGKGTIGFINPLIYNPYFSTCAFHDITTGGNPGCGTPGFTAAKGWDPVTGVGTPNTTHLMGMLLLLP